MPHHEHLSQTIQDSENYPPEIAPTEMTGLVLSSVSPGRQRTIADEAAWWMLNIPIPPDDYRVMQDNTKRHYMNEAYSKLRLSIGTPQPQRSPQQVRSQPAVLDHALLRTNPRRLERMHASRKAPATPNRASQPQRPIITERYRPHFGFATRWQNQSLSPEEGHHYEFFLNPKLEDTIGIFTIAAQAISRRGIAASGFVVPRWQDKYIATPTAPHLADKYMRGVGAVLHTPYQQGEQVYGLLLQIASKHKASFIGRSVLRCSQQIFDGISVGETKRGDFITERGRMIGHAASQTRTMLGIKRFGDPPTQEQMAAIPETFQAQWLKSAIKFGVDPSNSAWLAPQVS